MVFNSFWMASLYKFIIFGSSWFQASLTVFGSSGSDVKADIKQDSCTKLSKFRLTEVWHIAHFWMSYGRCTIHSLHMGWSEELSW